jgi:hypothetical protein
MDRSSIGQHRNLVSGCYGDGAIFFVDLNGLCAGRNGGRE